MVYIIQSYYKHATLLPTIYLSNIYCCEYCDHKASTNVQSVHDGVKHSCEYCDYKPIRKGSLQIHVQSFHDGV